jgi:hypothetical protein
MKRYISIPKLDVIVYPIGLFQEKKCNKSKKLLPACDILTRAAITKKRFFFKSEVFKALKNIPDEQKHINDTLKILTTANIIKKENVSDEKKVELLKNKKLQGMGIGNQICEWCGIATCILHKHHYPILKSRGGTQTVNICPNCHNEFHNFDKKYEILLPESFFEEIRAEYKKGGGKYNERNL